MQRVGFLIRVKTATIDEYRRLHQRAWPELLADFKAAGIRNYTLWLQPDGLEFGYLECDDWQAVCAHLAKSAVNMRWQKAIGMAHWRIIFPIIYWRPYGRCQSTLSQPEST
jgi:L-rhamnose mutarotase